ncbi:MAG: FemAB family protein [Candidatus Peregrinibacteria bacterium Gr01-1014_25]|nr:MAG: FemAB family protein [Candidatus Peregrinibacteria bacterium Gr01-1014_25]
MSVRLLTSAEDLARYETWIHAHPQGNLWQSIEWKRYQASLGRSVRLYGAEEGDTLQATAIVVIDRTVLGLSTWDVVRGPLWNEEHTQADAIVLSLLRHLLEEAQKDRCLAMYISSPQVVPYGTWGVPHTGHTRCEQLEATILIDLTQSEEQILANMHQKARYNIKVAMKHGVVIREHTADDPEALDSFYRLVSETAGRDGFTHLSRARYEAFLRFLGGSFLLMAWHDEKPVAGLIGVAWNGTGIYYYGASGYAHRALMAPSLLQWEAMRLCKRRGCHSYDLLGIEPPTNAGLGIRTGGLGKGIIPPLIPTSESLIHSPWAGITSFKTKFGGQTVTYPSEQMIVLRPWAWRMLRWKRRLLG